MADQTLLASLLQGHDRDALRAHLDGMKPADLAAEADDLSDADLRALVDRLPSANLAALMRGSEDDLRLRVAECLNDAQLLAVLGRMHNDDAADVLGALDPPRTGALLAQMRGADRHELQHLLQYPAQTAGSIMTTSFLALSQEGTVDDCLALIRAEASRTEQIQTLYVLGPNEELEGYVDLRRILSSPRTVTLSSIMERQVISVDAYADQEEAAQLVARYDLNALPVVSAGRLLGVITVDDIIDVIVEEYDEDLLALAGANREESLDSPLRDTVRMRLPWLLVNLVTAFLASAVVALFEGTIEQVVALSAIMTIVSGMGGNAGSQTMAIAVRHLSHSDLSHGETLTSLGKEISAGIIDGAVNGLVTGIVVWAMYGNPWLSVIVLAAMIGNMVIAGTAGLLVPVALKTCGQDPAVASSIFVTTATDVLGFLLFLGLARVLLPLLL